MSTRLDFVANWATILSFPLTVLSVSGVFGAVTLPVPVLDLPFSAALVTLGFFMGSLIFGSTFARWHDHFDTGLGWDRFITVPLFGFLSAAQTYMLYQLMGGQVETAAHGAIAALAFVLAIGLEVRYRAARPLENWTTLTVATILVSLFFLSVFVVEAHTSDRDEPLIVFFGLHVVLGIVGIAAILAMASEGHVPKGASQAVEGDPTPNDGEAS